MLTLRQYVVKVSVECWACVGPTCLARVGPVLCQCWTSTEPECRASAGSRICQAMVRSMCRARVGPALDQCWITIGPESVVRFLANSMNIAGGKNITGPMLGSMLEKLPPETRHQPNVYMLIGKVFRLWKTPYFGWGGDEVLKTSQRLKVC